MRHRGGFVPSGYVAAQAVHTGMGHHRAGDRAAREAYGGGALSGRVGVEFDVIVLSDAAAIFFGADRCAARPCRGVSAYACTPTSPCVHVHGVLVGGGVTALERGAHVAARTIAAVSAAGAITIPIAPFRMSAFSSARSAIVANSPAETAHSRTCYGHRSPRLNVIASNGRILIGSRSFALAISTH